MWNNKQIITTSMEEKPTKIIYGTNIEHQENHVDIHDFTIEGGTFYLSDLGKKQTQSGGDLTDPLSATALKGFIEAGLLDQDLMPDKKLSRGQKAVLAQAIATRLNMKNYWPYFEKKWSLTSLRSDCSRFKTTQKYVNFQKHLNAIK